MKKTLLAALLGFLAATGAAHAEGVQWGPTRVDAGVNIYFNLYTGNAYLPLAPWYNYWPYDGQHLSPGPLSEAAQWQTWPGGSPIMGPPPGFSITTPQGRQQAPAVRSAAYYPGAPSYWYGR